MTYPTTLNEAVSVHPSLKRRGDAIALVGVENAIAHKVFSPFYLCRVRKGWG
jgi:hypothetical protein